MIERLTGKRLDLLKDMGDSRFGGVLTKVVVPEVPYSKICEGKEICVWNEVMRVLKPGSHVLSMYGVDGYDKGLTQLRLAGFEVRDCIDLYHEGGGEFKSLDLCRYLVRLIKPLDVSIPLLDPYADLNDGIVCRACEEEGLSCVGLFSDD